MGWLWLLGIPIVTDRSDAEWIILLLGILIESGIIPIGILDIGISRFTDDDPYKVMHAKLNAKTTDMIDLSVMILWRTMDFEEVWSGNTMSQVCKNQEPKKMTTKSPMMTLQKGLMGNEKCRWWVWKDEKIKNQKMYWYASMKHQQIYLEEK